jgi:hypothetical protein
MTAATAEAPATLLPQEKSPPRPGFEGKKLLLYGAYKVGKTTLAAELSDRALFLSTEPGQDALEVFKVPVRSWRDFRQVGGELASTEHPYDLLVVDTVDELARLCVEDVIGSMAQSAGFDSKKFHHASDFDYGKGWDAIAQEFRLRVGKLCNLGIGVVFISHEKESVQKTRTGLEITKLSPDVGQKGMRKWLLGFVDFVVHASVIQTTEGEQRVLRLKPSETAEAGGRVPPGREVPETIELSAATLKATLDEALA